jgi:hypothetical protein
MYSFVAFVQFVAHQILFAMLISVLLVLVLLQKTVGGLYLHNWLHTSAAKTEKHIPGSPEITATSKDCSCIDDFYVPFIESAEQLVASVPPATIVCLSPLKTAIPYRGKDFHSLRGPPAIA